MSGEPAPPSAANDRPPGDTRPRTVLLAEDDDAVRAFVQAALEQSGYAVAAAPDGRAAGDLFAADPDRFDLVLTDVVMPHAIGPELAARVRHLRPGGRSFAAEGGAGSPDIAHPIWIGNCRTKPLVERP